MIDVVIRSDTPRQGQRYLAQGNALGNEAPKKYPRPERAKQYAAVVCATLSGSEIFERATVTQGGDLRSLPWANIRCP